MPHPNHRFVQQPTDVWVNEIISPAVTVQLLDADFNPVAESGVVVTVSIFDDSGPANWLRGTLSRSTDASGLAVFDDLYIGDFASFNLTLRATTDEAIVGSDGFTSFVNVISLDQQPAFLSQQAEVNQIITTPIKAKLYTYPSMVLLAGKTLVISKLYGDGDIVGTLSKITAGDGIATFNDISFTTSGGKEIKVSYAGDVGLPASMSNPSNLFLITTPELSPPNAPTNLTARIVALYV